MKKADKQKADEQEKREQYKKHTIIARPRPTKGGFLAEGMIGAPIGTVGEYTAKTYITEKLFEKKELAEEAFIQYAKDIIDGKIHPASANFSLTDQYFY